MNRDEATLELGKSQLGMGCYWVRYSVVLIFWLDGLIWTRLILRQEI